MNYKLLFPDNLFAKEIRAKVIKEYLQAKGENSCVCFSCGNASAALKSNGLNVIEVINPNKWWSFSEIAKEFQVFDATSGHLPFPLYYEIAKEFQRYFKNADFDKNGHYQILAGSGETMLCMVLAFPGIKLHPIYNINAATKYNSKAPLNMLIQKIKAV